MAAAGGFSNSVVTTAHDRGEVLQRGLVVERGDDVFVGDLSRRRVRVGLEDHGAVAHRARRHHEVSAELATTEDAERCGRRDHCGGLVAVALPRRRRRDVGCGRRRARSPVRDRPPPAVRRRTARRSSRRLRRWQTWRPVRRRASARSSRASPVRRDVETRPVRPSTGTVVFAASIPGKCAAPPAPAMIARSPRSSRRFGEAEHLVGHAMRRQHPHFVGKPEVLQHLDGLAHRRPVAGRPHHHCDQRALVHRLSMSSECLQPPRTRVKHSVDMGRGVQVAIELDPCRIIRCHAARPPSRESTRLASTHSSRR